MLNLLLKYFKHLGVGKFTGLNQENLTRLDYNLFQELVELFLGFFQQV